MLNRRVRLPDYRCFVIGFCFGLARLAAASPVQEISVTNDLSLKAGEQLAVRLVVRASFVTIDGQGATLQGPGTPGEPKSLEGAGVGILIEGCSGVTLTNIHVRGFATGLMLRDEDSDMGAL